MEKRYYFDTSIWLDFLEERDEPQRPKSTWARELVQQIVKENSSIVFSDNNLLELEIVGYSRYDIDNLLGALQPLLVIVETTSNQLGKAKDLAQKRAVPKRDALHALIARDHHALLITLDHHFNQLTDIIKPHHPKDMIGQKSI